MEINDQNLNSTSQEKHISPSRQIIRSFEAKLSEKRTLAEKIADYFTKTFGSTGFFILNFLWFGIWVVWNSDVTPLPIFDPYPFGLLTMIVSLEAIFLAVLVLISQNRAAKIDKLRSEVDLQINMIAEQEITKIISLLTILLEKQGVNTKEDPEVQKMLKRINLWEIEKKLEKQLEE